MLAPRAALPECRTVAFSLGPRGLPWCMFDLMVNPPSRSGDVSPILESHLRRFADLLRFAVRRHGLAPSDLDELEQEVRIRLWRALGSGEKIAATSSSYMYRTAMSAAVDLIRRRRHEARETLLTEADSVVHRGAAHGGEGEAMDLSNQLEKALGALSRSRAVAVRMHLAGYPREEIGQLLGWSEAKTRNLVYRGLADLRDRLTEMGLGPGEAT